MLSQDTEMTNPPVKTNQSLYDPSRETVGAIYRNAQVENQHEDAIVVGDLSHELTTSLVEDINDALKSFDIRSMTKNDGQPYYLMIHEKRDLQMKKAFLRRMLYFGYRPWPEDDTVVFWKDPKTQDLRFCWALPHSSEMENMLANPDQFAPEFIEQVKAWKAVDMAHFGFYEHPDLKWIPNPNFKDKSIEQYAQSHS